MNKENFYENPIIVMKFGGTSLRDEKSRLKAITHIKNHFKLGKKIIVVVSAMGRKGEPYSTDTLISLMKKIGEPINPKELDSVISIGETLSASLFAHLLNQHKLPAESFSGSKAGILTDNNHGNAEIIKINPTRLEITLNNGKIAVVAGFQGINKEGDVHTLGRGGSDTSAVAIGSSVNAESIEIFSDVDGIANCDPNKIPYASFLEKIGIKQVMYMANEGSKVIHPRAVKASIKRKTPIILRNTFSKAKGTTILHKIPKKIIEQVVLSHREEMTLLEVSPKKNLKKLFDEMLLVDKTRFVLKNDIYIDNFINKLKKLYGEIKRENGWATISVVFEKKAGKTYQVPCTEIIFSNENIIRYLLKEDKLLPSLKLLFNHYNLVKKTFP